MKVCHISSAHRANDTRIFHKQCKSLARTGYEVSYVVSGDSFKEDGVSIVGIGDCPGDRLYRMTRFARKAYEVARDIDADIYELHDPELLPYAIKLKKLGKKVIFDSHEDYVTQVKQKEYLPKPIRLLASKIIDLYQKRVFTTIDAVIFPWSNDTSESERLKNKVVYLDNLPLQQEIEDLGSIDVVSNYETREKTCCYIGILTHSRGVSHLVKAAENIDGKVILAGKFSPDEYKDEVFSLKGAKNLDYRGYISRAEVVDLLKKTRVGVCTLLNVGQYNKGKNIATKVYEYMAASLPVVLSDSPYAREIMEDYPFAILVDPENSTEVAGAIQKLFDDPVLARKMGEAGRRAVLDRFSWSIEEKKLFALYEKLGTNLR